MALPFGNGQDFHADRIGASAGEDGMHDPHRAGRQSLVKKFPVQSPNVPRRQIAELNVGDATGIPQGKNAERQATILSAVPPSVLVFQGTGLRTTLPHSSIDHGSWRRKSHGNIYQLVRKP